MRVDLRAKCLLVLSHFNKNWDTPTNFHKIIQKCHESPFSNSETVGHRNFNRKSVWKRKRLRPCFGEDFGVLNEAYTLTAPFWGILRKLRQRIPQQRGCCPTNFTASHPRTRSQMFPLCEPANLLCYMDPFTLPIDGQVVKRQAGSRGRTAQEPPKVRIQFLKRQKWRNVQ
jgi:hypothetical protein